MPHPAAPAVLPEESVIREVDRRLRAEYGLSRLGNKEDPLDELIFIILSGKTAEATYQSTFGALKAQYPDWNIAARASVCEIEGTIRFGGLAGKKAAAISRLLRAVVDRVGQTDLTFLEDLGDAGAESFLRSLPGVGPKTARCVLAYSLGRQAFAVDAHVSRMAKRLGWSKHHRLTTRVQDRLQESIPPELRLSLHVNLVLHGRLVCRALLPQCTSCILADLCPSGGRLWPSRDVSQPPTPEPLHPS